VGITAAGFGDVLPTPVSGRTAPLSGVEFHANAFSAIAQDRVIQPIPDWVSLALWLFSVIIIGRGLFPRWRPLRTLGLAAALTLLPVLVSYGLLRFQALWLAPGGPALTATLAFPCGRPNGLASSTVSSIASSMPWVVNDALPSVAWKTVRRPNCWMSCRSCSRPATAG